MFVRLALAHHLSLFSKPRIGQRMWLEAKLRTIPKTSCRLRHLSKFILSLNDFLTVTIGTRNYTYPAPLCSRERSMRFGHNRSCSSNYKDALALVEAYFAQNSISPVQMIFKALSCDEIKNGRDSRCMMI